jgi:hypothetical protein
MDSRSPAFQVITLAVVSRLMSSSGLCHARSKRLAFTANGNYVLMIHSQAVPFVHTELSFYGPA